MDGEPGGTTNVTIANLLTHQLASSSCKGVLPNYFKYGKINDIMTLGGGRERGQGLDVYFIH